MALGEPIILSRDCDAIQIPSGLKMQLAKGARVRITQSLGGSFTLLTEDGAIVRLSGMDGDAIGKEITSESGAAQQLGSLDQLVLDQLKTCYDPEIPVNIVDLGLIYECKLSAAPQGDGTQDVNIKMTLTAPGCGMGEVLKKEAETKIKRLPGVGQATVELVWEPPWDQSKMSDAAKLKLGML